MDCALTQERLTAFHLGRCDAAGQKSVTEHLSGCRVCLDSYWELKEAMHQSDGALVGPSPRLFAELSAEWSQICAAARPSLPRQRHAAFTVLAAAAVLVLLLFHARKSALPEAAAPRPRTQQGLTDAVPLNSRAVTTL